MSFCVQNKPVASLIHALGRLTAVSGLALSTITGALASEYYNCSSPSGCVLVTSAYPDNDLTATQYPVVLVHGLGGFNEVFNTISYFNGIPEALMQGGTDVYVTKTSSMQDAEYRGEQLLQQVKTIVAVTGKQKVNLVGHSLGGIDIRYVASVAPEYVASVTAVASPEQGSKMADWLLSVISKKNPASDAPKDRFNLLGRALIAFHNAVGRLFDYGSGMTMAQLQHQDSIKAVSGLTTQYMTEYFNKKYPEAVPSEYCGYPPAQYVINGIPYYSFSGVGTLTNGFDPSDYMLALTALTFDKGDANDGLVSACSSRLGYVIRDDYKMNHLDSVNQIFGLVSRGEVDPITVYRNQINRLKNEGY